MADLARNGSAGVDREPSSCGEPAAPSGTCGAPEIAHRCEATAPLWPDDESAKLSRRWEAIQDAFVDKPRKAVRDADKLVTSVATRMAEMFADERAKLEGQWDRGGEASTEDLRIALLRYRAFFGRLLVI